MKEIKNVINLTDIPLTIINEDGYNYNLHDYLYIDLSGNKWDLFNSVLEVYIKYHYMNWDYAYIYINSEDIKDFNSTNMVKLIDNLTIRGTYLKLLENL